MKSDKFNSSLPASQLSRLVRPVSGAKNTASLEQSLQSQQQKSPADTLFKLLKVGHRIDATVIKQLPEQKLLQIKIGNSIVNALSNVEIPPGTNIKLEVLNLGKTPELRIVSNLPQFNPSYAKAFKQALPKQLPLSELTGQLKATITNRQLAEQLPRQIQQLVAKMVAEQPKLQHLSNPTLLKKTVQQSGVLLERHLSDKVVEQNRPASSPIQNDQKAKLYLLLDAIRKVAPKQSETAKEPAVQRLNLSPSAQLPNSRPTATLMTAPQAKTETAIGSLQDLTAALGGGKIKPQAAAPAQPQLTGQALELLRELATKTEGAISRIVLDQLASLPKEDGPRQQWQITLPFFNADSGSDTARLKILKEEQESGNNVDVSWSVVLEIKPPGLGTVYSKIILNGDQVDTFFWSDSESTRAIIDLNLEKLEQKFLKAGLATGLLATRTGKPVEANQDKPEAPLLSEHA